MGISVLNSRVTVTAPQNIKLNYSLNSVNTKHPVKYKTQNLPNNRVLYTWEVQNLPAIKGLEDAPYPSYYIPHLIIYIEQVTTEQGKTTEVLGSTEKLYQWYNSLAASVDTTTSASLRKTVADLLQNLPQNSNNEAKAKTIYEWVQNNIKYVAFEDGLGGFIPRPPNGVYDKKFGDCKDMSILIATMLRLANVPAWLGWVGTRDLPYTYQNMPTPNVDNHMIAVTKLNNEYVFLDGTGEYQPFGKITSMIQGKEVLIGLSPKNFEIVKLPTIAASNNIQHEKITLTIADGRTVTGQAEAVFTGYKKIYTQYNKVKAEYDGNTRFYDDYLKKASNKFEITAISTSGEKPREAPLHINYNFKIPDYTVRAGNNIYLNPHLLKRFGGTQLDSTRTVGRENEYPFEDVLEITIPIPDGYEVDVLPSNSQFEHSQFGYRLTYAQEGKNLVLNHHFWVNYLLLPATEFAQWNKMVNQLETQFSEAIVFKKIK
ncbi:MAG: transglutaminase domain-containing protein [Sphingobacteriales bacterium]|nr:transglutaminase domain-containing protein [Sphingobacteriales bacterium]